MTPIKLTALALALLAAAGSGFAQKSTSDGIAEYRAMLQDGNPAELFEAKGDVIKVTINDRPKVNNQLTHWFYFRL